MQFLIANQAFDLPDLDGDSVPRLSFLTALDAANSYASALAAIRDDAHLSSVGKAAKLAPLTDALWKQIFTSVENVANERQHWNRREAALLDVGTPSTPYEIARDQEIRAWWRAAPVETRERIMRDVEAGPEHGELVRAILRSPVPDALDLEKTHFRALYNQISRLDNPGEALAVEAGRRAVDWAERGMQHVIGISHGLTERPAGVVLRLALKTGYEHAAASMFDAASIAQTRSAIAAEQRRAA